MYKCEYCGNIRYFTVENILHTYVKFDDNGEVINLRDKLLEECIGVVCTECGCKVEKKEIISNNKLNKM